MYDVDVNYYYYYYFVYRDERIHLLRIFIEAKQLTHSNTKS